MNGDCMKKYLYLLERIKESADWPKGCRIYAHSPCKGWRIVKKLRREIDGKRKTRLDEHDCGQAS